MAQVLVVDDHEDFCFSMKAKIEMLGHECRSAHTCEDGIAALGKQAADLVFLDVLFPGGDGISAISDFKRHPVQPEIVIMTASGDVGSAERAMRGGALDYLVKPIDADNLSEVLQRALSYRAKRTDRCLSPHFKRAGIIGTSGKLMACLCELEAAASSPCSVLVRGETGAGKELFARALKENGPRADKDFVVVDCTNLPANLAESLLFGHEKGAFTGAEQTRDGLVHQADGGTLFLDEVGDLDLHVQKSLLRVLQEGRFRPLSSKQEVTSDFRLVAATNRNLNRMVKDGEFRKDLYYRLSDITVRVPSLRERQADIEPLARHYLERSCARMGKSAVTLSRNYLSGLKAYDWPGNVRELINTIHHSVANGESGEQLCVYHLPLDIRTYLAARKIPVCDGDGAGLDQAALFGDDGTIRPMKEVRAEAVALVEKNYLAELVGFASGDVSTACKLSGLSRTRLYELLSKHELAIR